VIVVTRTNRGEWYTYHTKKGKVESWVVRFIRQCGIVDLGFDINRIFVCHNEIGHNGKGRICASHSLTHFVDNKLVNLWSMMCDIAGNCGQSIRQADGRAFQLMQENAWNDIEWPQEDRRYLLQLDTWKDIALYFKLPYVNELWDYLCSVDPPKCPPPAVHPSVSCLPRSLGLRRRRGCKRSRRWRRR
jgi:hypothetical protein